MHQSNSTLARVLCALLVVVHGYTPAIFAAPPSADIKKIESVQKNKVKDYFVLGFDGKELPPSFDADLQELVGSGQNLGFLRPEFKKWLAEKKLTPKQLKDLKEMTLSELVAGLYASYVAETADALDAADAKSKDKKKKDDEVTPGQQYIVDTVQKVSDNPIATTLVLGVAGGIAWFVKWVGTTLWHGFVAGPIAATTNTALEPVSKPIQDYLRQKVNKAWAPKLRWWTLWWTGEGKKREQAKKALASGKEATGDALHYLQPHVETEPFTKDSEAFYDQILAADLAWRGFTPDEQARARQTGFEVLFNQPRLIGEQVQNSQIRLGLLKLAQVENIKNLKEKGAKEEDVEELRKILAEINYRRKYVDLRDPAIAPLEQKALGIIQKWEQAGLPVGLIDEFYTAETKALGARDMTVFVLSTVLYAELYYQEYNRALGDLHALQAWQEQSREMIGFYEAIEEHAPLIEAYFKKKGLPGYSVAKRIAERGYPLGGPRKPADVAPVSDPIRAHINKLGCPWGSVAVQGQ